MATESYERGEGWLFFAFVILVIVGFFNVVLGLTMIAGDNIYVTARDSGTVVIGNVNGWGWSWHPGSSRSWPASRVGAQPALRWSQSSWPPWLPLSTCRDSDRTDHRSRWCSCPCWSSTASQYGGRDGLNCIRTGIGRLPHRGRLPASGSRLIVLPRPPRRAANRRGCP